MSQQSDNKKHKAVSGRSEAVHKRFWSIKAQGEGSVELRIFGDIGYWEDGNAVDADGFIAELSHHEGKDARVLIDTIGGNYVQGSRIAQAIRQHFAGITTVVVKRAYSMGSLIWAAGHRREMYQGAEVMFHAPWIPETQGNWKQLKDLSDELYAITQEFAQEYANYLGATSEEMMAYMDGKNHFISADDALAMGFSDATIDAPLPMVAKFDDSRFTHPAATAASPKEEPTMATKDNATAPQADSNIPEPQGSTDNVTEIEKAALAKAQTEIKARNEAIHASFKPFMHQEGVRDFYDEIVRDPNVTAEAAGKKLLAKLAEGAQPLTPSGHAPRVEAGVDESDKRREGVSAALMVRAGVATSEVRAKVDGSNPFRGMRLLDIARDSAKRAGVRVDGADPMEIVKAAFTQSTSDFSILLEDAMHKTLQNAYAVAPNTWSRFCATGSVSDFRDHSRYRIGSLGNLETVNENGEYLNKPIPDGEKSTVNVDTKGYIINVTRKMVVNDDLGAFLGLSQGLGRAAARSIEADVYALIGLNSGLGPTQADSEPLMHANRNNVDSTGGVNSTARWDAMSVIMAQQMDVGGNDYLDLRPAIWLGPIGLRGLARQVNEAEYDDEATKNQRRPNISRGMVSDIVASPRLAGTRYYLLSDPAEAPVFEVAFLDGQQTPFLDMEEGFRVDGTQWKVRLDYGVHAIDYRGIVTNAGG